MAGLWGAAWAIASSLAAGACGGGESAGAPTERELGIFTETILIEAVLQDFSGPTKDTLAARYYDQLYDRYGISDADLDALRRRYNDDVALWQAMTDTVEARLERSQADPAKLLNPESD